MAARADVRQLLLQVDANVELARRALDGLDRDIGRDTASIDRSLGRIDQAMGRVATAAAGFLTIRGLSTLGQQFLGIADQAKQMESQLKLATGQFGSFSQAQQDAERIATVTRNGISETTSLYANFLRASDALGKTQNDAARATETFSKALKIGGAGAAEAASATLQFGQALASGVLRGDEFNSIAEASPRILRLLADALGVSTGALRGMAAEGKLTSDVLYRALTDRKFTESIDAEFRQLPKTFDEAMTLVHNSAVTYFGAFDRGGQFSTAIANFVTDGADGFRELSRVAEEQGQQIRAVFDGLAAAWDPFEKAGMAVFHALGLEGKNTAELIGDYISFQLRNMQKLANFPFGGAFGLKPFTFADDYDEERRLSASRAIGRTAGEEHLQRRADFYKGINALGSREEYLGIYDLGLAARPSVSTPTSDGAKRTLRSATRKSTDADLTPMQLIVRDIGKEGLPIDAGYQKELTALTSMDDALASIGTSAERIAGYEGAVGKLLSEADKARFEQFQKDFARDFTSSIADAVVYADSLGDALSNAFKRAAASLIESGLMELLAPGGNGGGLFRGFVSGLGGLFGGFRAGGGPVSAGRAYVVGEKRPEIFVPDVPGMIMPNVPQMMAGSGGPGYLRVEVDKSDYFDVRVSQISQSTAAPLAIRAAQGGAAIAERRANQRARNTLR